MTIVIISNFLNHHQLPWIESLMRHFDVTVTFISTEPVPSVFLSLGYSDYNNSEFNLHYYDKTQKTRIQDLVLRADVVLMGGTRVEELIELRLSTKKLLLFYSERWHKRVRSYFALPLRLLNGYLYHHFIRFNKENCYMLCNGAYVVNDCRSDFAFYGKTFKWGYFPCCPTLNIDELINTSLSRKRIEIIWVARFLKWKKPFLAVRAIEKIHNEGYDIHLTMVGGIYKDDKTSASVHRDVANYIKKQHLENLIEMAGVFPHDEVQSLMRKSDIFLFTSNRYEGWGAVLNEAMSNGCVPVASHYIGAVPFLIRHKENGLIFKSGSLKGLVACIKYLLDHKSLIPTMRKKAYLTIHTKWSPDIAANNLLQLIKSLLVGKDTPLAEGPCSKAVPTSPTAILKQG